MYYTIASLEDMAGNQTIDFDKDGNKYTVSIYNKGTKENCSKTYKNFVDAEYVYMKFVRAVLEGLYSFEERKKFFDV